VTREKKKGRWGESLLGERSETEDTGAEREAGWNWETAPFRGTWSKQAEGSKERMVEEDYSSPLSLRLIRRLKKGEISIKKKSGERRRGRNHSQQPRREKPSRTGGIESKEKADR